MNCWVLILAWLNPIQCQDGNETSDTSANEMIQTSTGDAKIGTAAADESTTVLPLASPEVGPSDVRLNFAPSLVTVHFTPVSQGKTGERKGCEVYICGDAEITKKCHKKRAQKGTSASFKGLKHKETFYTTVRCFSQEGRSSQSPWIMFVTPTKTKRTIPEKTSRYDSGIEVALNVDDGLNLDLSWSFSFINGSKFPIHHVKAIEIYAYKKPREGIYTFNKITEDKADGSVTLGLSPSFTFDTGCHFYAINVTFIDDTTSFYSTDETCYGCELHDKRL
ncbi:hypothetical protein Y032_0805g2442 [Ancylostoma ceylanicum]|uniref:Fibronectin type-III domain-containing protein n=1 Tax=Ancylostoma ceylanicum TaxID=53326 RepID=A0A016WCF2_9BILA|nr:hypothetical protein Y032_0805g2442 [Ancylostoma ceylanicum]